MHHRFNVLDVQVSAVNLERACSIVDESIQMDRKGYVCVAPVSTIVSCQESGEYKEIVNNAEMVAPDGMPLVWLAKMMGHKEVRRTYGPDLMLTLCDMGQEKGYRHFLYGGSQEASEKMVTTLKKKFPNINIVGRYSPPFRESTVEENEKVIDLINNTQTDILWVGLGAPKQDYWMKNNRDKLDASMMIGVGAAFDFLAGTKKQAPIWMRNAGLEWVFRLCSEPKRLWKRYLIGNTRFIYLLMKNAIKSRLGAKA